jgi:hypothetical protein
LIVPSPTAFAETVHALSKHAGKVFEADWEWTARCNDGRQAYFINPEDGTQYPGTDNGQEVPGCGKGVVYQSKWPTHRQEIEQAGQVKTITVYNDWALCPECSAVLYPFGELVRFKAAGK